MYKKEKKLANFRESFCSLKISSSCTKSSLVPRITGSENNRLFSVQSPQRISMMLYKRTAATHRAALPVVCAYTSVLEGGI